MAKSTKTVQVTPAQKRAAKGLISRSAKTGRYVSPSVSKIANAKSATTGRYVNTALAKRAPAGTKTVAKRAPASTVTQDAPAASRTTEH